MSLGEIQGVQKPVVRYARSKGWLAWKMEIVGINGCPDYFFFRAGRVVIIEFKKPGKPRRKQQELRAADLAAAGFEAHLVDNVEQGKAIFDREEVDLALL